MKLEIFVKILMNVHSEVFVLRTQFAAIHQVHLTVNVDRASNYNHIYFTVVLVKKFNIFFQH